MNNEINDLSSQAPLPILQRLELNRLALTSGVVEAAAAIVAISEHEPGFIAAGTALAAVIIGGSVYDAHEHHVNGYPRKSSFVKERRWPTIQG